MLILIRRILANCSHLNGIYRDEFYFKIIFVNGNESLSLSPFQCLCVRVYVNGVAFFSISRPFTLCLSMLLLLFHLCSLFARVETSKLETFPRVLRQNQLIRIVFDIDTGSMSVCIKKMVID